METAHPGDKNKGWDSAADWESRKSDSVAIKQKFCLNLSWSVVECDLCVDEEHWIQ